MVSLLFLLISFGFGCKSFYSIRSENIRSSLPDDSHPLVLFFFFPFFFLSNQIIFPVVGKKKEKTKNRSFVRSSYFNALFFVALEKGKNHKMDRLVSSRVHHQDGNCQSIQKLTLVGGERGRGTLAVRLSVEEGLGVGRGQAGNDKRLNEVPLLSAGGAEELAKRARSAAARASTVASEGTGDIQALADVVAGHGHGAGHAEAAGEAVGNDVALVAAGGVREELAGAAMGAKAPRKAAE